MSALVVSLTASCASQMHTINEYKELTKDVCRENPREIALAQSLYNKMKPLKYGKARDRKNAE